MLQIGDELFKPGTVEFTTSIELTLEVEVEKTIPVIGKVDDVPLGFSPEMLQVMIWNPIELSWELFDPSPVKGDEGLFITEITSLERYLGDFSEAYFALEPTLRSARFGQLYR